MPPENGPSASQTLSRGIRILEILADAGAPLTIAEATTRLGVHRSVAYRLLRTLEDHGLVVRDSSGRVSLGARMAALAAGVAHDLQAAALPELTAAAAELGTTCFVAVLEGDECITLTSVEPRQAPASIARRPGARHPVVVGAPGRAILAQLDPRAWPGGVSPALSAQITEVTRRGYATSHDEVIPNLASLAVPLAARGQPPAAVAVVYVVGAVDEAGIVDRLTEAANAIRGALGG